MLAPKPVCWSFAEEGQAWLERGADAFEVLHGLARPGVTWACANAPYDVAIAMSRDYELMLELFKKYERGEIFDVSVAATLDAIAEGRMTEGAILDRSGKYLLKYGDHGPATNRFSLLNVVHFYLNRLDAKENDLYRLKYGDLDPLPTDHWPIEAQKYPLDDARNQFEAAKIQRVVCQNIGPIRDQFHDLLPQIKHTHMTHQTRAHLIMHLGSIYGLRTDPVRIAELEAEVVKVRLDGDAKFRALGFIKTEPHLFTRTGTRKDDDGKDNGTLVKRKVILAYGGDESKACTSCEGTGKVISAKSGNEVNCKPCAATGLDVPFSVPRTPADGVCADRDILKESGNDDLVAWAEFGLLDKLELVYLPWLKQGVSQPINVRANILVSTGRSSYDGLLQLLPGMARECIVPPSHVTVEKVEDDYQLQPGEEWADE